MKTAILVGYIDDSVAKAQREPFVYNEKLLKEELNLQVKQYDAVTFSEISKVCNSVNSDIIFLLPTWKESLTEEKLNNAENIIRELREKNSYRKLIFIDPFAQTTSNYFRLLPYVDYFLKRQRYQNLDEYQNDFIGGSKFTDFLATQWKFDLSNWYTGSKVSSEFQDKIKTGWNLGTAQRFKKELLRKPLFGMGNHKKEIDIFCRLSLGKNNNDEWYSKYRATALDFLEVLASDYKVAISGKYTDSLVSQRQYFAELKGSRLVFSPFGWGENCWRDFEAVCYDCLLVKPSMAHIDTKPNIFIEGKTYVAVKCDFSDLEEKCRYYLQNPEEAAIIIANARRAYQDYFKKKEFVKTIQSLL